MEGCRRTSPIIPALVELHNVEVFALPREVRDNHYVGVIDYLMPLESLGVLLVPLSAVLAYYSGNFLRGCAHSQNVWFIAKSELAMCTVMSFLSAGDDVMLSSQALYARGYWISVP